MLLGVLFVLLIALPILIHVYQGVSLTSVWEESIGYRYFNTLRILYSDERPWIPQAQLPGVVHIVIQLLLSAVGYPINQIFPRVDVFNFLAVIVPVALAGVGFYWASKPLDTLGAKSLLALSLLAVVYTAPIQHGWLTNPDYMIWIVPIALVTVGWILRLRRRDGVESNGPVVAFWLGIFTGLCLSIKPTLIVFPIAVGLSMIAERKTRNVVTLVATTALLSFTIWLLIILLYYKGSVVAFRDYFSGLLYFTRTQANTLPEQTPDFLSWLVSLRPEMHNDLKFLPILAPAVLLISTVVKRSRRTDLFLLAPCGMSIAILYARCYNITFIEAELFAWIILALSVTRSLESIETEASIFPLSRTWVRHSMPWVIAAALIIFFAPRAIERERDFYKVNVQYKEAKIRFNEWIQQGKGETAFLSANNTYRLTTVDGAICKGGGEIFFPEKGLSPFMRRIFPHRWCGQISQKIDLHQFENLAFLRLDNESLEMAIVRLETAYQSTMTPFDCAVQIPTQGAVLVYCRRVAPS